MTSKFEYTRKFGLRAGAYVAVQTYADTINRRLLLENNSLYADYKAREIAALSPGQSALIPGGSVTFAYHNHIGGYAVYHVDVTPFDRQFASHDARHIVESVGTLHRRLTIASEVQS